VRALAANRLGNHHLNVKLAKAVQFTDGV
jgi:hypothetical protein